MSLASSPVLVPVLVLDERVYCHPLHTGSQARGISTNALAPVHLEVVNESCKHNEPTCVESYFTVFVVSESFDGKNVLARHRLVSGELQK